MQEKGYVFWAKMQEKGCVSDQRLYYSKTILKNFRRYVPFFREFVHKRVHFCQICKKNRMFSTEKLQEKGCLFHKFCKRKGMDLVAALAHPHTKFRQVPPPGI